MALYVVLHHEKDESQPWRNAWLNEELIEAIQTTSEIGALCQRAKERGERVFVHRCGWGECSPIICCSAEVEDVAPIDRSTTLVRFAQAVLLHDGPPRMLVKGQNFYVV